MSLVEHLEKLRHFHKLASYRSINEGAQGMNISQAGLSKSISNLENVLETMLFIRSNDGLSLTKEGEILLNATKKILLEASNVEMNLHSMKVKYIPKKFVVGMYDSVANYFYPSLELYINAIYPDVKIELIVDRSLELKKLVERGELDLAIAANLATKNISSQFQNFTLFEDQYSFYVSSKHKNEIEKLPIIFHPSATDKNGITIEKHLERLTKGRICHRAYNFETVKALTLNGLGIGVLPSLVAKSFINQKNLIQIKISKTKNIFGEHAIDFIGSANFMNKHYDFATDIRRVSERWILTL